MKALSTETRKLLDRLYNLRGKDSVILENIKKDTLTSEETKTRTSEEKTQLEKTINELSNDERVLAEQGEKLKNVLKTINEEDFAIVLDRLKLDFNPDFLSKKVNELLPTTIEEVVKEKQESVDKLSKVEAEMDNAITKIEELAIRKDDALSNQTKLNEYFKLALSGNINITRDSITSLLENFKFDENEQREAAKILMFPEDGLFTYEEELKNGEKIGKSISDVFAEAKEVNEEPLSNISDIINNSEEIIVEEKSEIKEIKETNDLSDLNELKIILNSNGIESTNFDEHDLNEIKKGYNKDIIIKNIEYMKKIGINLDIFVDNYELLTDEKLEEKVSKLINIGKIPFDIYLNPNILLKYNLEELNQAIDLLVSSGLDPQKVPLMAF